MSRRQRGMGAIMAIVVLVIMASLAGAMVSFGNTQAISAAQEALAARALRAARAGTEWGLFQALDPGGVWYWNPTTHLPNPAPCDPAAPAKSQTLDLTADAGFWVTVTCQSRTYNEARGDGSGTMTTVYSLVATACNSPTGCPDPASGSRTHYVERQHRVVAAVPP